MTQTPKFDCTFLHTTTEEQTDKPYWDRAHQRYRVKCPVCAFQGPWRNTEREAIEAITGKPYIKE